MALLTKIDLSKGASSGAITADSVAASQTITVDSKELLLRVYNGSGANLSVVVKAPTAANTMGAHAVLGDLTTTFTSGQTKIINLQDTARYMDLSTGLITATASVDGGTISNAKFELIQM